MHGADQCDMTIILFVLLLLSGLRLTAAKPKCLLFIWTSMNSATTGDAMMAPEGNFFILHFLFLALIFSFYK